MLSVCAGTCVMPPLITWVFALQVQVERSELRDQTHSKFGFRGTYVRVANSPLNRVYLLNVEDTGKISMCQMLIGLSMNQKSETQ